MAPIVKNDNNRLNTLYTTILLGFLVHIPTIVSKSSSVNFCGDSVVISSNRRDFFTKLISQ